MVLESILRGQFALKHPLSLLLFAIVIATASMGISILTFPEYASVLTIAFITIGSLPVFFRLFVHEEKSEATHPQNPLTFLERHFHIIKAFAFFFIGIVIAYAFWYQALPLEYKENVFKEQEKNWQRITAISGQATGNGAIGSCQQVFEEKGNIEHQLAVNEISPEEAAKRQFENFLRLTFSCIFANNAIVLAWSLLLSFFYGAGAIFLVAWNASVIGLVIGKEIMVNGLLSGLARATGLLPHGLPEIVSYFIGAIAGGIISVAIARKRFLRKEFETIAMDVLAMVIIAYIILLIAALIEAYLLLSP
jgi:uncharacterized membrane protein SpoIIM required for sporulation